MCIHPTPIVSVQSVHGLLPMISVSINSHPLATSYDSDMSLNMKSKMEWNSAYTQLQLTRATGIVQSRLNYPVYL